MIGTGTLMVLKGLLTAAVLLGLCVWQLAVLRRLRRQREAAARYGQAPYLAPEASDKPDSAEVQAFGEPEDLTS